MTVVTRKTYYFDDLEIGMQATTSHTVTEQDIVMFSEISGDRNPVHLDKAYAETTIFKDRIAHGMLTASYVSAVFGMELPGPGAIYITQTLNFKAPVYIGAKVIVRVTLVNLVPAKRRAMFDCVCMVDGKVVLDGEALLMVPNSPE